MNKQFTLFLSLLAGISAGIAQNFYVVSHRDAQLINKTFILNLSTCDSILQYTCPPSNNTGQVPENQYADMTTDSTGIYYVSAWGSLYRRNLGDTTSCQYLGNFNYVINALATDKAGTIYAAGQQNGVCRLYKYQAGGFSLIGNFPANYFSAGDLFFYNNELFLTGINSNLIGGYIVKVDVTNPMQSCYFMNLPGLQPWAAFSVNSQAGSRAFVISRSLPPGPTTSTLYELNMQSQTLGPLICTYPFSINGAAAAYEQNTAGAIVCVYTGIAETTASGHFMINNPMTEELVIEGGAGLTDLATIRIYDLSGRQLKSYPASAIAARMDVSDLPAGVYLINLETKTGGRYAQKLVKY